MWCPRCGKDTRVLETDKLGETVTRVRWCRNSGCRFLFETHEVYVEAALKQCAGAVAKPAASAESVPETARQTGA
jgi:transcriptional regulator NrdR family protein